MSLPDLALEAALLRAAMLLGLVHERAAHPWAERWLAQLATPPHELTDLLLAEPEFSAVRAALLPLAASVTADRVLPGILAFMDTDPGFAARPVRERVLTLKEVRRELPVTETMADALKGFEGRQLLADVQQPGVLAPSDAELRAWLASARGDAIVPSCLGEQPVALSEAKGLLSSEQPVALSEAKGLLSSETPRTA